LTIGSRVPANFLTVARRHRDALAQKKGRDLRPCCLVGWLAIVS